MDHRLTILPVAISWALALGQTLLYALLAPLLAGWVRKLKALLQNRHGAPIWQPYRDLYKLFGKEARMAHTASPLFRAAPYIVFVATWLAACAVPLIATDLPTAAVADVIVIAGLLALARFLLALAAMDVGTAFGGMGASREMFVSALAEPAMLLAVFTLAMTAHSTNLATVIDHQLVGADLLRPSFMFALAGLVLVAIAETGRIPVDNPATHLELTMIHEAMVLEYSARHLALMEWAAQLKLFNYVCIGFALFLPWGVTTAHVGPVGLLVAVPALALKLALAGVVLALIETVSAKMRVMRIPEYLATAFLFAVLGLLVHVLLGART